MTEYYIHVGCGKTGSSALQVWFSQVSKSLSEQGCSYPLHGKKPLSNHAISSGNGGPLIKAIEERSLDKYFNQWASDLDADKVLFSSEHFQLLSKAQWQYLLEYISQKNSSLTVVAFVRDVYDIAYSSYQQLLKRNTFIRSFDEYVQELTALQQFTVVSMLDGMIEDFRVLHYNEVLKQGVSLSEALCESIDIALDKLQFAPINKVNRSLTLQEMQLMRAVNTIWLNKYGTPNHGFSKYFSDKLIDTAPKLETEIVYSEPAFFHLRKTMQKDVDFINDKYLAGRSLEILNKTGKKFIDPLPELDQEYLRLIELLVQPQIDSFTSKSGSSIRTMFAKIKSNTA